MSVMGVISVMGVNCDINGIGDISISAGIGAFLY